MTMEFGSKMIDIPVYEFETPLQLAYKFCQQQNWEMSFVKPVAEKIQQCLDYQLSKKKQQVQQKEEKNIQLRSGDEEINYQDSTSPASHSSPQIKNLVQKKSAINDFNYQNELFDYEEQNIKEPVQKKSVQDLKNKFQVEKIFQKQIYENVNFQLEPPKEILTEASGVFEVFEGDKIIQSQIKQNQSFKESEKQQNQHQNYLEQFECGEKQQQRVDFVNKKRCSLPDDQTLLSSFNQIDSNKSQSYFQNGFQQLQNKFNEINKKLKNSNSKARSVSQQNENYFQPQNKSNLYERGLKFLEQKEKKISLSKEKSEEPYKKNQMFHPQINYNSLNICSKQKNKENQNLMGTSLNKNCYEQLYENSRVIEKKKQLQKMIYENIQLENFTFQPCLSEISMKIMEEKKNRPSSQANQRKDKNILNQKCSFKPQINKNSQEIAKKIGNFEQRQQVNFNKSLIIKNKPSSENKENQTNLVNPRSDKLVEIKKKNRFSEIFHLLDSDQDGNISAQFIDISNIQDEILEIISPVLLEMEQMKAILNEKEFITALERLYLGLNQMEKHFILGDLNKKKNCGDKDLTFKPQINPKSIQISQERRGNVINLYDRYYKTLDEQSKNALKKKIEQEQKKIAECTFKPQIFQKKNSLNCVNSQENSKKIDSSTLMISCDSNLQSYLNKYQE